MGHKYEIGTINVVSCEMEIRLQYKDCEIIIKRNDKFYAITAIIISEKGYIIEMSETFKALNRIYANIIDYLNNTISNDIESVYQKLINKRNFRNKLNN